MEAGRGIGVGAGVATSTSVSRLPSFFSSSSSSSINSNPSFFLREHLHWPSSSHQVVHSQLLKSSSSSVYDGNRKNRSFRQNYSMDDSSSHEDQRRTPRGSSSGRSSNQKRLLTLFKQIETSISQEKARSKNERDSTKPSKDSNASFDSVLETLKQSGRPGIGQTLNQESDNISNSNHDKRVYKREKEPILPEPPQPSPLKAMRPPSIFMKKSPIPSSSTQRISSIELTPVESPEGGVYDEESKALELGKMKLTELKELAKARGIKGYSKLKKSELVCLLSTVAKS